MDRRVVGILRLRFWTDLERFIQSLQRSSLPDLTTNYANGDNLPRCRTERPCKTMCGSPRTFVSAANRGGVPRNLTSTICSGRAPFSRRRPITHKSGRLFHVHHTRGRRRRSYFRAPRARSSELKTLATVQLLPFCSAKPARSACAWACVSFGRHQGES